MKASGDVGNWHETYRVHTSDIETIYSNMPPIGLNKALGLIPSSREGHGCCPIGARPDDTPARPDLLTRCHRRAHLPHTWQV